MYDLQNSKTSTSLYSPSMKKRPLILSVKLTVCSFPINPPLPLPVRTIILNFVILYSSAFFMILLPIYP